MGLPIWKPRQRSLDEMQEDINKRRRSFYARMMELPATTERIPVIARHNNSNESVTVDRPQYRMSPSGLVTEIQPSDQPRYRLSSTGLITETQPRPTPSPENNSEVEERLELFLSEKKDLLEHLQETSLFLEQYLSVITLTGTDGISLSEFVSQASELISSFSSLNPDYHGLPDIESMLNTPPYSTEIRELETCILSAHRRIRQQLSLFLSIRPSSTAPTPTSPRSSRARRRIIR
ncbi:hypothetical protein CU098_007091 [Rhizopus stolonifer]|uniref:Uncharacterized protein n=1 Tax=Rhizopus stolonifer TaxID=4846 RepID=A0A367IRF5_RHIST|nr:hypothetical protein CU098_007091 [Rhizopus stolonifer]